MLRSSGNRIRPPERSSPGLLTAVHPISPLEQRSDPIAKDGLRHRQQSQQARDSTCVDALFAHRNKPLAPGYGTIPQKGLGVARSRIGATARFPFACHRRGCCLGQEAQNGRNGRARLCAQIFTKNLATFPRPSGIPDLRYPPASSPSRFLVIAGSGMLFESSQAPGVLPSLPVRLRICDARDDLGPLFEKCPTGYRGTGPPPRLEPGGGHSPRRSCPPAPRLIPRRRFFRKPAELSCFVRRPE